jgi:hypothetical protein
VKKLIDTATVIRNGEIQKDTPKVTAKVVKAKAEKAPKAKPEKAPKAPKMPRVTKAFQARQILAENPGITSKQFQEMLMEKLGMTKLGARTYAYSILPAKKILGTYTYVDKK